MDTYVRKALAVIAESILRNAYGKDLHHVEMLEALAYDDEEKFMQLYRERYEES